MRIAFLSFLLLVSASLGCATDRARRAEIDDIRETVFRWQFDHNASGQKTNATAYYLQLGAERGDPTDQFIQRFAGHRPPIRKVSECSDIADEVVVDKRTGERGGLIFRITDIIWKSATEVDVSCGYYEGTISASGNTCTAKKLKGKWIITADKRLGIS